MTRTNKRSGSTATFPVRLHDMMTFVETQGLDSVIGWVLGGRGFMIHDSNKLVEVLSLFFGQTKYKSFLRQLNMWDFERIAHGPNKGTYMHPYFVKGNRELCGQMIRQIKEKAPRGPTRRRQVSAGSSSDGGDLGSFKSSTTQCSHHVNESLSGPSRRVSVEPQSSNSTTIHSLPTRRRQISEDKFSKVGWCDAGDFSFRSHSAIPSWLLRMSSGADGFDLDLEPSPIEPAEVHHPTKVSSTSSAVAAIDNIMKDFVLDEQEDMAKSSSEYLFSIDGIMNGFLEDESSCFAGKRFFLVENDIST